VQLPGGFSFLENIFTEHKNYEEKMVSPDFFTQKFNFKII